MKYAITGHTEGIGKRAFERLNARGFSRTNGYDITIQQDRKRIVADSRDCDVFINSAHSGFASSYLLFELYNAWKDFPNKTIVNVGSGIAESRLPKDKQYLLEYQAEKIALKEAVTRINWLEPQCRVKYCRFGYVGTEKILNKYPHFTERDYITTDQAVDIILSSIS